MNNTVEKNVFWKILEPVSSLIADTQKSIQDDSESYKLSFSSFTTNLLFGIICQIESIGKLIVEIKTSHTAKDLGLINASKSMYSEAFHRYAPELFRKIFGNLLLTCNFLAIPEIEHLGQILLIDGSVFPAIVNMEWAKYKKNAKAIKMQLVFELNRMIPVQFLCTEGNYSEKKFLRSIIEKGVTYICDRGYVSFELFKSICDKQASFIIRGTSNVLYDIKESIDIRVPVRFLNLFDNIEDSSIIFNNDTNQCLYRIVSFCSMGESYLLITNRFDLTTYEVIMLYAYRWQIELCFRFIKRTLKGIHLMCHNAGGIQVQFYLYMIAYLLLLSFKQECEISQTQSSEKILVEKDSQGACSISDYSPRSGRGYVCGLVSLLGGRLKKYWKIGVHWLIAVKNILLETFNGDTIQKLAIYT